MAELVEFEDICQLQVFCFLNPLKLFPIVVYMRYKNCIYPYSEVDIYAAHHRILFYFLIFWLKTNLTWSSSLVGGGIWYDNNDEVRCTEVIIRDIMQTC